MFERKMATTSQLTANKNIKLTLQTNTEYKPCRVWLSITLVKIANVEFNCSFKMGWQPAIWLPTMKYLPLTSHLSDCFSGRGLASAAYNYYSQLVYYSKTFRLGCASVTSIQKAPSGRLQQSKLCTKMLCIKYIITLFRYF